MTKHCRNCVYHMSGDPPACNALHTPIAGDVDCRDWEISSVASSAIAASQAWFNSGGADWIRSIAIRQSQVNQSFGYEIQESIGARNAAIARDAQRRADENESLREYYRIDRSSPAIALSELQTICSCYSNPLHRGQHLSAFRTTSERDRFGATVVEPIKFTAIATPNGLKWQYQGAVIID